MRNDCKGCTVRRVGCHANCESYKAYRAAHDTAKSAKQRDDLAGTVLSAGYIKRAKRAWTHDFKHMGRYRGT